MPDKKPGDEDARGAEQTGDALCPTCSGSGTVEGEPCPDCDGTGLVTAIVGDA